MMADNQVHLLGALNVRASDVLGRRFTRQRKRANHRPPGSFPIPFLISR